MNTGERPAPEGAAVIRGPGAPKTVLVIEDEPKLRELIRHALEPGCRIRAAADGAEGLAKARAEVPDLILLDLVMPALDGLEVLAKLKADQRTSGIPVIIVSAKGESEMLEAGQRAGALDFLIKPFEIETLRAVVWKHLDWE
jgi:CheY-like chemotaxis protein